MLRVLTVTLNPALDAVYQVAGLVVGGLNRPISKTISAGGKGLNVARAYRSLGGSAVAAGLAGGRVGRDIVELARAEGIATDFLAVVRESRQCIKIEDSVSLALTEVNESGPEIGAEEYTTFVGRLRELIPQADVVVLSGSIPPGVAADAYAELTRLSQDECGVRVVLDASGEAQRRGIQARPWLAKPNLVEARDVGVDPERWQDAAAALRSKYGLAVAVVTAGARGAVMSTDSGAWEAVSPAVDVKSVVGSGDSLLAGFLAACDAGLAMGEALRLGVAAGAVNAQSFRSGDVTRAAVTAMSEKVVLTRIAGAVGT